jgi:AcrR family transcriptional regulator
MGRRRPDRRIEWESFNKGRIKEAVVHLLSQHGAEALTMERVAEEAGVAKGTLYVYFADKKALLEAVKEATFADLREELAGILDGGLPPEEKLRLVIKRQLVYGDENRDSMRVMLWDRQMAEIQQGRHHSERYRTYVERIAKVLQEGMAAGVFRPFDARKTAKIFVEACGALGVHRLAEQDPGPVDDDVETLIGVLFGGILKTTAPGGKE